MTTAFQSGSFQDNSFQIDAGSGNNQTLAITLDDVVVAVSQGNKHTQALSITLDGVTASITQSLEHSQSLAITLDDVTALFNQSVGSTSKSQSLNITLDDISATIIQLNSTAPTQSVGGGSGSRKKQRIIIIEVDGKEYRVEQDYLSTFLANIQNKQEVKAKSSNKVKFVRKAPAIVVKDAPLEFITQIQQDIDYTSEKIEALFSIAMRRYAQELDDEEALLMLL